MTHEWLTTWWQVFSEGRELYILTARSGGQLVGIAPLLRRRVSHFGLPFHRLELLASGEDEADEICSEYLDLILNPEHSQAAAQAFAGYLVQHKSEWDEIVLTDVAGESPNLPLFQALVTAEGLIWTQTLDQICAYLPIPATHEELLAGMSGQYRKRIKKDTKTAEKHHIRVEAVTSTEDFEPAFQTLIRLHQERWRSKGKPGSFASEKFTRFHRELATKLLPLGWIKLWLLCLEDEPLCALYDFTYANKIFYYQSGMTLIEKPILSPGLLLRDFSLKEAMQDGVTECDFLKADLNSYKFGWGTITRPIVQIRISKRGPKERAFQAASRLVDTLRPAKRKLQGALNKSRPEPKTRADSN